MEAWARGEFFFPDPMTSAVKNAQMLGEVEALTKILELEYDDFFEEDTHGE